MHDLIKKIKTKKIKVIKKKRVTRCEFCGDRKYHWEQYSEFDDKRGHDKCIREFIRVGVALGLLNDSQKAEAGLNKKREAEASQSANTGERGENPVTACLGHHASPSC